MSAERPGAYTVGLWISHTQHPGAGRRLRPPVALCVCISTGVPRRRRRSPLFHAPIRLQCRQIVQRRSTGGMVIPWPVFLGQSATALPQSHSLRSPLAVL